MSDFFYRRYQEKTNDQLREIIKNEGNYQRTAVKAAIRIINERNGIDIKPKEIPKFEDKGSFHLMFDIRFFQKTFCFEDVLTWITLAFADMAFIQLALYFSAEPWLKDNLAWVIIAFVGLTTVANHIFFKQYHRHSNNFIGRVLHDFGHWFLLAALSCIYLLIANDTRLSIESLVFFFVLVLGTFFFEFFVSVLKRFLQTLFKLDIL
jgi:hypothetical protein